ncbi:hypothetical protein [Dactylosporangium sp. CS-033363]|uniref:hypothetical protein n=1 Tax=Dactylosporangium sp. CS-033363 TaxID=3239935 RepID=UPI003D9243D8
MGRRGTWLLIATLAVALAGIATATGSLRLAASSTPAVTAVFYSGKGCAGLAQAASAARRLRAQAGPCVPVFTGGTGTYNGRWNGDEKACGPDHATYPDKINGKVVTQLAGFSLGRLGPLYLLRASDSLAANVDNILMLDPGGTEVSSNACDTDYQSAENLRDWLAEHPEKNRLVIIAGKDTQADKLAAVNRYYLGKLTPATVTAQVLVCTTDLDHNAVMATFGPKLIGAPTPTSCPDGTQPATSAPTASPTPTRTAGKSPSKAVPTTAPTTAHPAIGSIRIGWSTAHQSWITMTLTGFSPGTYRYVCDFGSGGPAGFDLVVSGTPQTYDNGHTCQDQLPGDTVRVSIGPARSNEITVPGRTADPGSTPSTYAETAGGPAHTWTDRTNAGGEEGPTVPANTTVQISCVAQGFAVQNGNTNWYRIASDPWNDRFWVSADAFYNNGLTSGPLAGTPLVDPAVRSC